MAGDRRGAAGQQFDQVLPRLERAASAWSARRRSDRCGSFASSADGVRRRPASPPSFRRLDRRLDGRQPATRRRSAPSPSIAMHAQRACSSPTAAATNSGDARRVRDARQRVERGLGRLARAVVRVTDRSAPGRRARSASLPSACIAARLDRAVVVVQRRDHARRRRSRRSARPADASRRRGRCTRTAAYRCAGSDAPMSARDVGAARAQQLAARTARRLRAPARRTRTALRARRAGCRRARRGAARSAPPSAPAACRARAARPRTPLRRAPSCAPRRRSRHACAGRSARRGRYSAPPRSPRAAPRPSDRRPARASGSAASRIGRPPSAAAPRAAAPTASGLFRSRVACSKETWPPDSGR